MTNYKAHVDDEKYCRGCSKCCRWPGDVLFSPSALPKIAKYLEMDERVCADIFFDISSDRNYLKSQPTEDGGCIFLSGDACLIYPLRPLQCRNFPYTWQRNEDQLMLDCALYRHLKESENYNPIKNKLEVNK